MNTNNINLENKLKEYDPISTSSVFSALLLNPRYHYHQYTLETCIKFCLSFCKGTKFPTNELIKTTYDGIHENVSMLEDPVEDVFISKIWFENKSYRVQLGLWEGGVHSTQITLKVLEQLPDENIFLGIKKKIRSILRVSNNIIEQNALECNKLLNTTPLESLELDDIKELKNLINNVYIKNNEFLLPFLELTEIETVFNEEFGNSILEKNPFILSDDNIILLLPTAITICIRRQILEFFLIHNKKNLFTNYYGALIVEEISNTRIFNKLEKAPIKFYIKEGISSFKFSECVIEFDTNYFFHFIFILDVLENIEEDWFAGFINDKDYNVSDFIDSRIEKIKKDILIKNANNKGCSIIIPCGIGRGFALTSKFISDDNWLYESISDHDLITISNDSDCTPFLIWRIIEAKHKLKKFGTEILNFNGLLNLYAYIKDNSYSIFVNENFNDKDSKQQIQPYSMLTLAGDYIAYIREKVALDINLTEVQDIDGKIKIVRKAFSDSFFSVNSKYNLHIPEKIDGEHFEIVYLDYGYEIWIKQFIQEDFDFTLQYKLFDASITWLSKTIFILEKYNIKIDKNLKLWFINFELIKDISNLEKNITKIDILDSFRNTYNNSILNTSFNINLLKGFLFEENYSEQALIISFLSFLKLDQKNINILLKEIIINEHSRLLHFFKAHKFREHFNISEKKPITIHQIDEQIIKLNLGWSCRSKEEGNIIEGKEECRLYLHDLMDVIWKELQLKLKQIERESLINKLLENYEYSQKEKETWQTTFKSNLALQEDKDNLYEVAINKMSEYTSSSLSSRLVIEMAICECSVNCGKEVGKLDIQELMSLASFMHLIGGLSEAIIYEAIPAQLVISSFGDILFDYSFNDIVIKKYGYSFGQKTLDYQVTKYSEKFKEKEYMKETNHLVENDFINAYIDEFGYTIDNARLFLDFLEDYGLKIDKLVYSITYNELLELFDTDNKEIFTKVLESLIIHTRRDWTKIPEPYKSTDWQPWKFRRRYSIIMKPIIEVDSFEGLLIISPELIRAAYSNLTRNIHEGYLEADQFQSKLMKKWIGNLVRKKGLAFNTRVKEKFIELGYEAKEEIKLTEILNKKMIDFGDIDVFAWNKEKNIVYVIECKDLEMAKTQSEIARQLYEFKGQINNKGKKDRLYKHHVRYEELKNDLEGIKKYVKFDNNFKIQALVIFSNIVPMNFDTKRNFIDEIDFYSIDECIQLLS